MRKKADVLTVPVDAVHMEEAVALIEGFIAAKGPHLVVTPNAEMIMLANQDTEVMHILEQADLVLADGAGVVWAARQQGCPLPERVAGADLVNRLMDVAALKGYKVFLLGAAPGIAKQAAQRLTKTYGDINICGSLDGYFTQDREPAVIEAVKAAAPDILLVGLGVPRQEKWLWRHKETLGVPVCVGIGGVIDVLAGVVQRAPVWMQKAGLEWLYRLIKQPWRWKRMMVLPRFVLRVWKGREPGKTGKK